MKKLITFLQNHLRKYFVSGQFNEEKTKKEDKYMNYLRKTEGTVKQQWERVCYVIKYPVVVISLVIGLGSLLPILLSCNTTVKTIFTTISTIGLGVGINYFTFYLKETREYKILNSIGEQTVKSLAIKIENVLSKTTLTQLDKNEIRYFIDLIDLWKDYVEYADTSKISYHQRLTLEIEEEKNIQNKKLLELMKNGLEKNWVNNGVGAFINVSGSTFYKL